MTITKTLIGTLSIILLLFAAAPTDAQIEPIDNAKGDFGIAEGSTSDEIKARIKTIVNTLLGFVSVIALIFFIWGGFQYITSAGDEQKAEGAKKTLIYATIGLVVIGLAAVIVNFIVTTIGG